MTSRRRAVGAAITAASDNKQTKVNVSRLASRDRPTDLRQHRPTTGVHRAVCTRDISKDTGKLPECLVTWSLRASDRRRRFARRTCDGEAIQISCLYDLIYQTNRDKILSPKKTNITRSHHWSQPSSLLARPVSCATGGYNGDTCIVDARRRK